MEQKKEQYIQPVLVKHELLRDITAKASGHANNGFGNGGNDGVPGHSNFTDFNR
jgi:hypothetical protein